VPLIWQEGSPFEQFSRLSDWIFQETGQTHAIALMNLVELLFRYLSQDRGILPAAAAEALWEDYQRGGRSDCPPVLRQYVAVNEKRIVVSRSHPPRQARHLSR
jgi:hypothetical protein